MPEGGGGDSGEVAEFIPDGEPLREEVRALCWGAGAGAGTGLGGQGKGQTPGQGLRREVPTPLLPMTSLR